MDILDLFGERVAVYRNLQQQLFSVRGPDGRVAFRASSLYLEDCKFRVQPAGRAKVLRTKQKNVHAFIYGTLAHANYQLIKSADGLLDVTYNPYRYETFVVRNDDLGLTQSVLESDWAYLTGGRRVRIPK